MRLLVALDIDESIRERIRGFVNELKPLAPNVRWVSPESLHITLKFIGEQPESKLSEMKAALERVSAAATLISFAGCGFFPNARSPRVFWIGIEGGTELARIAKQVEEALAPLGIEKEKRGSSPHLTLARARRDVVDAREQVARMSSYAGERWPVRSIRLVHSTLGATVNHETLAELPLAGSP
jgi:2'-5' RNA ligase